MQDNNNEETKVDGEDVIVDPTETNEPEGDQPYVDKTPEVEPTKDEDPVIVPETEDEQVQVSKASLEALFNRLNKLEEADKAREQEKLGIPPSVFNRTKDKLIKVRKWDGKYVIGWDDKGVYEEPAPNGRDKIMYINIIRDGEKEPMRLNYLHYLNNSNSEWAKVIDTTIKPEIQNYGVTYAKVEHEGRMMESDQAIPLDVKLDHRIYEVETSKGIRLTMSDKYIH